MIIKHPDPIINKFAESKVFKSILKNVFKDSVIFALIGGSRAHGFMNNELESDYDIVLFYDDTKFEEYETEILNTRIEFVIDGLRVEVIPIAITKYFILSKEIHPFEFQQGSALIGNALLDVSDIFYTNEKYPESILEYFLSNDTFKKESAKLGMYMIFTSVLFRKNSDEWGYDNDAVRYSAKNIYKTIVENNSIKNSFFIFKNGNSEYTKSGKYLTAFILAANNFNLFETNIPNGKIPQIKRDILNDTLSEDDEMNIIDLTKRFYEEIIYNPIDIPNEKYNFNKKFVNVILPMLGGINEQNL